MLFDSRATGQASPIIETCAEQDFSDTVVAVRPLCGRAKGRIMSRVLTLLAGAILFASATQAQIGRATIQGTISDPQLAAIGGVAVRVTQSETNTVFNTTTNDAGFYAVPGVPVGNYNVVAEHQGFKRGVRSGIVLQVGDQAQVDFRLEIGSVTESVEVMGSAPLVETSSATVGKVIENARMTGLPLNGRSALALVVLTPNVRSHAESPHGLGDRGVQIGRASCRERV